MTEAYSEEQFYNDTSDKMYNFQNNYVSLLCKKKKKKRKKKPHKWQRLKKYIPSMQQIYRIKAFGLGNSNYN